MTLPNQANIDNQNELITAIDNLEPLQFRDIPTPEICKTILEKYPFGSFECNAAELFLEIHKKRNPELNTKPRSQKEIIYSEMQKASANNDMRLYRLLRKKLK
jgi:hypothetical protein